MLVFLSIIFFLFVAVFVFFRHPRFGSTPGGDRLERIRQSPNFRNGKFHNLSFTPQLTEGYRMSGIIYSMLFKKIKGRKPDKPLPNIKTDFKNLSPRENLLVWFGHSSYFIQLDGLRILVDPVFSGNASPIRGTNRAFAGADFYSADDMPSVDFLFITHDHYDHLDHRTVIALKEKTGTVVCPLGVGAHLERWGYEPGMIIECDWQQEIILRENFKVTTLPARHFSGRGFTRNNTLWASFLIQAATLKIYVGGDSGYDASFAEIGNKYGPIDLAILDNGQYNDAWRYIHAHPDEVLTAAKDLKARRLLPVHSSKFTMANHTWQEPLAKISELNKTKNVQLVTPMIGEVVKLDVPDQQFKNWWESI